MQSIKSSRAKLGNPKPSKYNQESNKLDNAAIKKAGEEEAKRTPEEKEKQKINVPIQEPNSHKYGISTDPSDPDQFLVPALATQAWIQERKFERLNHTTTTNNLNVLLRATIPNVNLNTTPAVQQAGSIIFNTVDEKFYFSDGNVWNAVAPDIAPTNIIVNSSLTPNGKTIFNTIQSAINSLANSLLIGTSINVAPGTYNETLTINSLVTNNRYGLSVKGDLRPFVGVGFNHGYPWNSVWTYSNSLGNIQNNTSIGGGNNSSCVLAGVAGTNTLTVTAVNLAQNPNFVAAGVVAGDEVYIRQITGPRFGLYTVLSVAPTVLTFTSNLTGNANGAGAAMTILPNVKVVNTSTSRFNSNIEFKGIWFQASGSYITANSTSDVQLHFRGCVIDGGTIGFNNTLSFFSQIYDDADIDVSPFFLTGLVFINQTQNCFVSNNGYNNLFGCSFWPTDASTLAISNVDESETDLSNSVILMNHNIASGINNYLSLIGCNFNPIFLFNNTVGGISIVNNTNAVGQFIGGLNITGGWQIGVVATNNSNLNINGLVIQLPSSGIGNVGVTLDACSKGTVSVFTVIFANNPNSNLLTSVLNESHLYLTCFNPLTLAQESGIANVYNNSSITFNGVSANGSAISVNTPAFNISQNSRLVIPSNSGTPFNNFPIFARFDDLSRGVIYNVLNTSTIGGVNIAAFNMSEVELANCVFFVSGSNTGINTSNGAKVGIRGAFTNNAAVPVSPAAAHQLTTDQIGNYVATYITGLVVY